MKAWIRKHPLFTDIVITVLLSVVIFAALEIKLPYFFLQDDNCDSYICQYVHSLRSVMQGEFPFYNFHQFGGVTFLDKGQTGQLNLFVYLGGALSELFLGNLCGTVDAVAFLYLIAGSVGMLILLEKVFSLSGAVSITGAIAWSFNAFSIRCGSFWIITIILTGLMPWIVLGTKHLMHHKGIKALAIAAIPKVCLFYGGHPQYFIYAVIFDYIFALSIVFVNTPKGHRMKAEGEFTLNYFLSGLIVALWSLPLLGPMWEAMQTSVDRAGKLSFEAYSNPKYELVDFILNQLIPYFGGVAASHIGYVFSFSFVAGIFFLIGLIRKKKIDETVKLMLATLPGFIISMLWAGSEIFERIIYCIPILNRFRYPMKLIQFAIFFYVIFTCAFMSQLKFKKTFAKTAPVLMVALEVVNLIFVYYLNPVTAYVVRDGNVTQFDNLPEEFYSQKYLSFTTSDDIRNYTGNCKRLAFNYSTLYGYYNQSGYNVMDTEEILLSNSCYEIHDITGSVYANDLDAVEDFRKLGVGFYVISPECADYFEESFSSYGMVRWFEDEDRVIFKDSEAVPLCFADGGLALNFTENVNSVVVNTDDDFAGGSVTINFTHDHRFIATVDGVNTEITDSGDYSNMTVLNVPSGSHEIEFKFIDNTFRYCLIISLVGTMVLAISMIVISRREQPVEGMV